MTGKRLPRGQLPNAERSLELITAAFLINFVASFAAFAALCARPRATRWAPGLQHPIVRRQQGGLDIGLRTAVSQGWAEEYRWQLAVTSPGACSPADR